LKKKKSSMALAAFSNNSADIPMIRRFKTGFTYSVSHFREVFLHFRFFLFLFRVDIFHRFKKIAVVRFKNNPGMMKKKGQNLKARITNGFRHSFNMLLFIGYFLRRDEGSFQVRARAGFS